MYKQNKAKPKCVYNVRKVIMWFNIGLIQLDLMCVAVVCLKFTHTLPFVAIRSFTFILMIFTISTHLRFSLSLFLPCPSAWPPACLLLPLSVYLHVQSQQEPNLPFECLLPWDLWCICTNRTFWYACLNFYFVSFLFRTLNSACSECVHCALTNNNEPVYVEL